MTNPLSLKFTAIAGGIMLLLLIAAGAVIQIQSLRLDLKDKEITAITLERDTAKAETLICRKDQETAYEISDQYQKRLTASDRELATYKRMLSQSACVIPCIEATGGCDATTSAGLPGKHGIRVEWLLEEAARANRYTEQLGACQDWIEQSGKNREQK